MTVNVYLTFEGNCLEAVEVYKSIFGGEFDMVMKWSDMPPNEHFQLPDSEKDKVMHMGLPISKETMLMGSDRAGEYGDPIAPGNNFSISVTAESREEVDRVFNALAASGQITMPVADQFWGDYFGSVADQFGIHWMVGFTNPKSA